MARAHGARKLPKDVEPVVAQAMLNAAHNGLLNPTYTAMTFALEAKINREYDAWMKLRTQEIGDR